MIKTLTVQKTHHQMIQTLKDKNIKISLQKQQTQSQELACIPGLLASIRNRLIHANRT